MSVIDLLTRVDTICKKYDKYDIDKHKDNGNVAGDDAFARLYAAIESEVEETVKKSEAASAEKSRATVVAMNAEIRRTKARLLEEIPKLQRLAFKKVKGLPKEELETRGDLVTALKERIEDILDGTTRAAKPNNGWTASASTTGIKINSSYDGKFDDEYFQKTEESNQFRQEYEMRKMKQDEGLDYIAEGLDTLKDMAKDMNEEIDRQVPLMDEIDDKVSNFATLCYLNHSHHLSLFEQAPLTEELVFRACIIPLLLCGGFSSYTFMFLGPIFFSLGGQIDFRP